MVAGALATGLLGGLLFWSFGLYIGPIEAQFGWSRTEVSLGVSGAFLASGLASPLAGRWMDRYGPRVALVGGALICAVGFVLLSTTSALWQWYLYLCVLGVGVSFAFFLPFQVLASRWFDRRRGAALGLLGVGASLGGVVVVPVVRMLIDTIDWEGALLVSAALMLAYYLPLAVLIVRDRPGDGHPAPDGRRGAASEPRRDWTPTGASWGVAIRTPIFWVLALAISLYFYATVGLVVHAVPLFEANGISPGWAAGLVSAMAGTSILARLLVAAATDHVPRFEWIAMLLAACGILTVTVFLLDTSAWSLALFVVLWALADTGPAVVEPLPLAAAFGAASFATILGTVVLLRTVIMLISPAVAGAIFDASGSYTGALVMFLSAFGLSLLLFYTAMRLHRPVSVTAAPGSLDPGAAPPALP